VLNANVSLSENNMTTGSALGKEMKGSPSVAFSGGKKNVVSLEKPLEISEIKTEKAVKVREAIQSLKKRVGNARKSVQTTSLARVEELEAEMDRVWRETKSDLEKSLALKIGMNGRQILAQLADLELSFGLVSDGEELKSLKEMKKELEGFFPSVMDREVHVWFQGEMSKLRADLDTVKAQVELLDKERQKIEQDTALRRQIAVLKGYEDVNMLKGDVMKRVELANTVPKATRELLFHPVWLIRKLEKEFTVLIEKSRDTHSKSDGCFIAGTVRDVDACVSKLENSDFVSGKKTLLLDGKTLANVLNGAFEIEKDCGVIFFANPGSVDLTIYGSEKSVSKAMAKMGAVKEIQADSMSSLTSDRLKCNTAVAKAILNGPEFEIEQKCGVSLTLAPDSESQKDSWIVVRGPNESVSSALHAISGAIGRISLETLEGLSKEGLEKLFVPVAGGTKKGFSEVKLTMRFNELKKKAVFVPYLEEAAVDVAVLEPETAEVEKIIEEFCDIVAKSHLFSTERIELPDPSFSRIWSDFALCQSIASQAGADTEVSLRRGQDSNTLEIWGSLKAVENSKRLIKEVHDSLLLTVPEEAIKPMLENKCQVLQSIQSEAIVSVTLSKIENQLWIYGLDANKRKASLLFAAFFESVRQELLQSTIKTIPIVSDEIGRLIGPKGKTMMAIKDRSDLLEIRISEAEMKVYLTGSNSSIDHAVSLIEEELSARKDASVVQIGLAEDENTSAALAAGVYSREKTQQKNEWVTNRQETEAQQVPLDTQDLFPSLGVASAAGKPKMKWRK